MRQGDFYDYTDNERNEKKAWKQVWNPQINQSINKFIYVCIYTESVTMFYWTQS